MSTTTEQRVLSTKPKIGARPAPAPAAEEPAADGGKKGGKKKLIIIVLAVVLVLGGGVGYWFLLGPGAGGDAEAGAHEEEPAPEPGAVLTVEPVSINLAAGRYLRLGISLQFVAGDAHGEPDPSKALDLAIALFSGRTIEEVSSAEGRTALKAELLHQLEEAYHGDVMDVYLTDYVTQ